MNQRAIAICNFILCLLVAVNIIVFTLIFTGNIFDPAPSHFDMSWVIRRVAFYDFIKIAMPFALFGLMCVLGIRLLISSQGKSQCGLTLASMPVIFLALSFLELLGILQFTGTHIAS